MEIRPGTPTAAEPAPPPATARLLRGRVGSTVRSTLHGLLCLSRYSVPGLSRLSLPTFITSRSDKPTCEASDRAPQITEPDRLAGGEERDEGKGNRDKRVDWKDIGAGADGEKSKTYMPNAT